MVDVDLSGRFSWLEVSYVCSRMVPVLMDLGQLGEDFLELLCLQKRVRPDQRVYRFGHRKHLLRAATEPVNSGRQNP